MKAPPEGFLSRRTCLCCERPWGSHGKTSFFSWAHAIPEFLGGRLQSRVLCADCNSRLGARVEPKVLEGGVVRAALFDLQTLSPRARTLLKRVERQLPRWSGGERRADAAYRQAVVPQFHVSDVNPITGERVGTLVEPHHFERFWREELARRRARGLVLADDRSFLAAAFRLKQSDSSLAIPVPGGGLLRFLSAFRADYELLPTLPWQPIAAMSILAVSMFRHDVDLEVLTARGLVRASELLRLLRDGATDPLIPMWSVGWAPTPMPVVHMRFVLEQDRICRVQMRILGTRASALRFKVGPSPYPLPEFFHYSVGIDSAEEWLYESEEKFKAGVGVPLHTSEAASDYYHHLRSDSAPPSAPPPEVR